MSENVELNDRLLEDYLAAVYTLTLEGKKASASAICRHLETTPKEVRETLKSLTDNGYIEYSPRKGATLTDYGIETFTFDFSID